MSQHRPKVFAEFIGQPEIIKRLQIAIEAAKTRNVSVPHLIFCGGPGLGKTTLAQIVANEMGVKMTTVMAAELKKTEDISNLLYDALSTSGYDIYTGEITGKIEPNIIFLDEIHRLNKKAQEAWYPVIEDFAIHQRTQCKNENGGYEIKNMIKKVPLFTLIGATTEAGNLERPFRDRFTGGIMLFKPYNNEEMVRVLQFQAEKFGCNLHKDAALSISERARGTARVAIGLLERCNELATVNGTNEVTHDLVEEMFGMLELDSIGLGDIDTELLKYLDKIRRPVGLSTIAEYLGENQEYISDVIEPYLIKKGMLVRLPAGRMITAIGHEHLMNGGKIESRETKLFGDVSGV